MIFIPPIALEIKMTWRGIEPYAFYMSNQTFATLLCSWPACFSPSQIIIMYSLQPGTFSIQLLWTLGSSDLYFLIIWSYICSDMKLNNNFPSTLGMVDWSDSSTFAIYSTSCFLLWLNQVLIKLLLWNCTDDLGFKRLVGIFFKFSLVFSLVHCFFLLLSFFLPFVLWIRK